jgi:Fe-S oxidoreductase
MSCNPEVLLWKGCTYRNQLPDELAKIEKVLNKLEIPFSSIEEECCGYPLLLTGHLKKMEEQVLETAKLISPFNLIVTACPACLRSFKEIYQERLHLRLPRILHLVQFLSEKIDEGVLTTEKLKPIDMRVMYHDPCELGRVMNVSEDPRKILELIPNLHLYEQRFTKEASACCGGGGLLPTFSPTLASMAAARKLTQEDELPEDIDAIVTTCPQCILNMRRGLDLWSEDEFLEDVQVLDLAEIIDMAIGE